jgi:tRNA threonylcarbamoyladenosine biosynthesis protein TsaB
MHLLLIHTAGTEGSVALADTSLSTSVVSAEMLPGRSSSEQLVPAVRRLMNAVGWEMDGLGAIVVVHGPGSFTGVRVGLSAAKGFSEATGVPLIAVSCLALLAAGVESDGPVHAVLNAGRGEFYYGEYVGRRCVRETVVSRDDLMSAASGGVVVVCEPEVVAALIALDPRVVDEPTAGAALAVALERLAASDFDDAGLIDANYLRRTDLEIYAKSAKAKETR